MEKTQEEIEQIVRDNAAIIAITEEEKEAWEALTHAAKSIMKLPEDHPQEKEELSHLIHLLQRHLLSRPWYRVYKLIEQKT